jgi:hypothetical protein
LINSRFIIHDLFGPLLNERINRIIELNKEMKSKTKKHPIEREKTLHIKKEKEKEVAKDRIPSEKHTLPIGMSRISNIKKNGLILIC